MPRPVDARRDAPAATPTPHPVTTPNSFTCSELRTDQPCGVDNGTLPEPLAMQTGEGASVLKSHLRITIGAGGPG
jgi:hypothetical protein